jgi:hypothetical protein
VKPYDRKQLLERIDREGATVGADIPERITVQGEEVELEAFVFEVKRRETVPESEHERVERAKKNLRRERLQRKQRLEDESMSYEEGERLANSIVGIDRALNALESLEPTDLEAETQAQEVAETQRWLTFLEQALGQGDDAARGR